MRYRPLPYQVAPSRVSQPAGFNLAAAFGASFLLVALSHVIGLPTFWGVALIALVVGLCSTGVSWPASLGVAVIGWLFVTGFVINSYGELRITGLPDLWRVLLLMSVAVVSVAASRRRARNSWRVDVIRPSGPSASTVVAQRARRLGPDSGARTAPVRAATRIHG